MSPIKEAVIKLVQSLPEDCTLEDIRYQLYIRETVERGLRALEEGDFVDEDEADRRIQEWLDSSGPDPH